MRRCESSVPLPLQTRRPVHLGRVRSRPLLDSRPSARRAVHYRLQQGSSDRLAFQNDPEVLKGLGSLPASKAMLDRAHEIVGTKDRLRREAAVRRQRAFALAARG